MERFEQITQEDKVSLAEKEAFGQMQRDIESGRNEFSEDPLLHVELEKMIGTLDQRQQEIIRKRFFEKKSLQEVGDEFGITGSRVRDIEVKALRMLRHPSRMKYLDGIEMENHHQRESESLKEKLQMQKLRMRSKAEINRRGTIGNIIDDILKKDNVKDEVVTFLLEKLLELSRSPEGEAVLKKIDGETFGWILAVMKDINDKKEVDRTDRTRLENIYTGLSQMVTPT
ncbi:MAG: hypothetical protein KGI49_01650 [Patescibacteria group bacterium]|nr:hypothetical protein [Patescibacteria group bacterium]